ncbi:MAG: D-glycero-beta-D-manno-heptose-7-phosphate kinase [Elusimicrobia bacterium]|nr:D-glycero-beta-D-manno-heptose-7-phosphate kinase [Elusimicrobiota bacterium]
MSDFPSAKKLHAIVDKFLGKNVLVLGDLMLDQFIRGSVERISPEAPVPVVAVREETHLPGGAGNVCSNLAALGARVSVFGMVGEDAPGSGLLGDLRDRGVDVSGVRIESGRVTTQKVRVIAEHQQVVRFDRETSGHLPSQALARISEGLSERAAAAHALVISDYGKGVVTPLVVRRAVRSARLRRIPVVVDPKVEHFKRYRGVDCITPNTQEAWAGMRAHPCADEAALRALGMKILRSLRVRFLIITRGEKGMTLFQHREPPRHIPTQAQEVFDVTGAGDTVTSVMALSLACGAKPFEAAVIANAAAGVVVGKLGTATLSAAELRAAIRPNVPRAVGLDVPNLSRAERSVR